MSDAGRLLPTVANYFIIFANSLTTNFFPSVVSWPCTRAWSIAAGGIVWIDQGKRYVVFEKEIPV